MNTHDPGKRPAGGGGGASELSSLLERAGLARLDAATEGRFEAYLNLMLRWNARMNLTAVREAGAIRERHFVESIACARALPEGLRTLLDFGSGAGLPGIPIALCRGELRVTLAERQAKKAAFLREAVRVLGLQAEVWDRSAEELAGGGGLGFEDQGLGGTGFDCVTLRAVDRMGAAVRAAAGLVGRGLVGRGLVGPGSTGRGGWLAAMTSEGEAEAVRDAAGAGFEFGEPVRIPVGERRVLLLGRRVAG